MYLYVRLRINVRSSDAEDYSALVEENNQLKKQLKQSIDTTLFEVHDKPLQLTLEIARHVQRGQQKTHTIEQKISVAETFHCVAEAILQSDRAHQILQWFAAWLARLTPIPQGQGYYIKGLTNNSINLIRRELQFHDLIKISQEAVSRPSGSGTLEVWTLTDYGRRQLRLIAKE